MLRPCALDYGSRWDDNLPYAEFSYNNSYQANIEMALFKALYGKKYTTPLLWSGVGEHSFLGPDIIQEAEEKVKLIKDRLKIGQSRQKSYADNKRREVTYEAGDRAYLRVSPLQGVKRFGIKGKLAPRFIGPFKVLSHKGEVAYELELTEILSAVHNVFHVSQLKKCQPEMSEKPLNDIVPLEEVQLESDLDLRGEANQDIRDRRKNYSHQNHQVLQSVVESSHRGRSHLGTRRKPSGRSPSPIC
jgi:hypothetical protein